MSVVRNRNGHLYFLLLVLTRNEHLAETGRLGAEAVADVSLVVEGLKLAMNRERPNEGNGQGGFWPHGTRSDELDGSFPSGHAAASFALARVIASEYPSKPVQLAAYAFVLAISASRVTSRQHFPSDVLVGGTFGYLIGGYVVSTFTSLRIHVTSVTARWFQLRLLFAQLLGSRAASRSSVGIFA